MDSLHTFTKNTLRPLITSVCRDVVSTILNKIDKGELRLINEDQKLTKDSVSSEIIFGSGNPTAVVYVKDEWFWVRTIFSGSLGFAEAYMLGEVDCPDLLTIFKISLLNKHQFAKVDRRMSVISMFSSVLEPGNTPDQSKLNVAKHYDLSNNIFAAFLSPDMTYSCPLWLPPHDPGHSSDTLERAQERKYAYHIKAARIQSTDHVLEIGTGWGSFAIQVVRETGCTVTSITPSREQKALAEERIAAACLTDKITIILSDYREVPQLGIQYDKLVSIEMIEHIGLEYLEGYFAIINELLKKTGGVATFQCTLMAESFQEENQTSDSFIRKYIFPGGFLPSLTQIVGAINTGAQQSLIIDRIENLGGYGRALSEWTDTFKVNFDFLIRPEVMKITPKISDAEIEAFRRKWLYYFAYCQAGFDAQVLRSVTIRLRREGTPVVAQDYYT